MFGAPFEAKNNTPVHAVSKPALCQIIIIF